MATVSDELVAKVMLAIDDSTLGYTRRDELVSVARAAIAALSTPEFARAILDGLSDEERAKVVLPAVEEMLRAIDASSVDLDLTGYDDLPVALFVGCDGNKTRIAATLLDAYRAAKEAK